MFVHLLFYPGVPLKYCKSMSSHSAIGDLFPRKSPLYVHRGMRTALIIVTFS